MDLGIFIGQKTDNCKLELEKSGYKVIVTNNACKSKDNVTSIVVRAKLIEENVIELVTGDFTFIS